ncbi:undecaprenyl-diphosphatase [Thioclava sp.]|uniref:undecaprenyl-diphosphatase n=1 Tax=Thioclava sp. TaxID=1933450 RepID=UPI003AA8127D
MEQLNQTLFALVNGPADPSPAMLWLACFLADWSLYIVAVGLVVGWLRAHAEQRRALVLVGLATCLGLAVNFTIGAFWYHPRPFALGIGNQLIAHAADGSFPSDHGTLLFGVALSLLAFVRPSVWGWLAFAAAASVAWARVWLGIHWPLDMAGSFVVALAVVWIIALARRTRRFERVIGSILDLFDSLLDLARIPQTWVHRSAKSR